MMITPDSIRLPLGRSSQAMVLPTTFTLNLISGHRFMRSPLTRHLLIPYETGDHRAPSEVLEEPTPTSKCESYINSCGSVQGEEIFTSLPSPTKSIDESRTMGSTDGLLEDYFCK